MVPGYTPSYYPDTKRSNCRKCGKPIHQWKPGQRWYHDEIDCIEWWAHPEVRCYAEPSD